MNSFQRLIKYLAIAFAVFLTIGIVSLIVSIISAFFGGNLFGDDVKLVNYAPKEFTGVESLDIRNCAGNLYIKTGDTLRVEAENVSEKFSARVTGGGRLTIEDKGYGFSFLWFNFSHGGNSKAKITVYLPQNFAADYARINNGIGHTEIDALKTDKLDIEAGTGSIRGSNITANKANIKGGVGTIAFTDAKFSGTDIKCGVGKIDINGEITGNNEIDGGVGDVDLKLKGNQKDYDFKVHSGIGTIRVNGDKITKNYERRNNALNCFKINGGVGTVNIDFEE